MREIGDRFGIVGPHAVRCHLDALKKKGWIDWDQFNCRTIRLARGRPAGMAHPRPRGRDGGAND